MVGGCLPKPTLGQQTGAGYIKVVHLHWITNIEPFLGIKRHGSRLLLYPKCIKKFRLCKIMD